MDGLQEHGTGVGAAGRSRRPWRLAAVGVLLGSVALAGCGSDASSAGPTTKTPATAAGKATTTAADEAATPAVGDASRCETAAVTGDYLYEVHGDQQFEEGFAPVIEVGLMTFDGKGSGTRLGTLSSTREEAKASFTYEAGEDCVGTITTDAGTTYRATFSPGGDEVTFFAQGKGSQRALDGAAERMVGEAPPTCDTSTLQGTYQYRARGAFDGQPHVEHGFEVYDGKGGVTNAFRVAGADEQERLVGTYEVDDDCHAVVTYGNGVTLDQYVSPDGAEFYWVQTDGFDADGLFGGHEHRVSTSTDTFVTTGR
ncbi:hypothetical protein KSP35_11860 [Aquihabitans sp. G128]|uniref:hypothetical protein n=1 Tax=Aquihabitans sp. G128 TaxID=2849779 RepID=UPI001C23F92B|nr:hypothetical protein [Aquihabitans sp. G128]QXC59110.1 hypothetical protein KSP35_11860 [Aquihabitans sp. G128]